MNPPPSFTFLPPPPLPNPNPCTAATTTTTLLATHSPDLHTTLSTLKHFIQLSKATIHSISNLFPTTTTTITAAATCPYNSNHRLPPTSLFRHHLQCSSSPAPIDLSLLDSLHYPNSLQSPHSLINHKNNCFTQTLPKDANTDLCFSLDDYHTSLDSNFFYTGCPAVVSFPHPNNNADRMLTLPVVLAAECANFSGNGDDDMTDTIDGLFSSCYLIEILPSEYWNVRTEINQWNDYPSFYSFGVLRSLVCLYTSQKEYLLDWVLVNSPFYGVVIDGFMRDHILFLFKLCLKAIAREAVGSLVSCSREEPKGDRRCFQCPVLVRVSMWLASQLAILYGEVNGKLFAINMLKQFLLIPMSRSLFLSGEQGVGESSGLSDTDGNLVPKNVKTTMGMVFVSQVAAAVAALHERSVFETRIKAIRASRSVSIYHRVAEHGYISKIAEEERKKRSNYRPVIEHDGVLWQRGNNQENNKNKTREELLAEERDYKRRRMSYRGKKMKRSTTQVMRDIIEEYMEEIKQASMVGRHPEDVKKLASEPSSIHDRSVDSSKVNKGGPYNNQKESVSDTHMKSATSEQKIKEKSRRQEHYTADESRYNREYASRNADGHRISSRFHDHGHRNEQKHSRKYHPLSPDSSRRSKYKNKNQRSPSIVHNEFEDRYNPSKSCDIDEHSLYSES